MSYGRESATTARSIWRRWRWSWMISTLAFVRQKTSQLYNYFTHPDTKARLNPILGKALAVGYPLSAVAGKEGWLCELVWWEILTPSEQNSWSWDDVMAAWHRGIVASYMCPWKLSKAVDASRYPQEMSFLNARNIPAASWACACLSGFASIPPMSK